MGKQNLDKIIINTIPALFILSLFFLQEKSFIYSSLLLISILVYEIIVYSQREIYGFTGLGIVSIPSVMIATFTIFIAVPSVYVCTVYDNPATTPYFASIIFFYIFFPMGLYLGSIMRKIDLNKISEFRQSHFINTTEDKLFYEFLLVLFSICVLILLIYLYRLNDFPIIELINDPGNYIKLQLMREEAFKTLEMSQIERYLFTWERSMFLPFGIIGSLYLKTQYGIKKYNYLFYLFFITGIFVNSLTTEKSPIAAIFLSIVVFFFLKKNRITVKFVIGSILSIFAFPILIMYLLLYEHNNTLEILFDSLLYRIFIIPSEVLYQYYEIFPNKHEFLHGKSTQLFSWIYDEGTFPISNYVAKIWWDTEETTGFCNAMYFGNFWADFGLLGVILSTIILGLSVHLFFWKLLTSSRYLKDINMVVILSVISPILIFNFFSSNITVLIITRGLIFIIIFLFVISKIRSFRDKIIISHE